MTKTLSSEEIFDSVRACLADSLALDADSIRPDSRLIDDLGADSLDFLDILFNLEKRLAVKLRGGELDRLLKPTAPATPGLTVKLTADDVRRLEEWLPALRRAPAGAKENLTPAKLFSYVTAEAMAILVERRLTGSA